MKNESKNEIINKEKEEINNIKNIYSEKESDLNISLTNEEKNLFQKQKEEINELIKNFDIKIKPKISSYYLLLKTREYLLARQDRFIEAQETKEKAQKQYMEDNKFIDNEKKMKLWKKIEELNDKHKIEYDKFIKEKNKKIYELKKEEDKEKNEINNKYKDIKEKEIIKNTINNYMNQFKEKKQKIVSSDYKRNKNNPFM